MIAECEWCGKSYKKIRGIQKYCSPGCKRDATNEKAQQYRKSKQAATACARSGSSFRDVQAYIDQVQKETGVLLSYGKAVVRMEQEVKK